MCVCLCARVFELVFAPVSNLCTRIVGLNLEGVCVCVFVCAYVCMCVSLCVSQSCTHALSAQILRMRE